MPAPRPDSQSKFPQSAVPAEPYGKLFLRFLRFGLLAWGGPVAQIDMVRTELVTEERWVTPEHFRRLLAVYQVLPGPEAHELCVHLGMLARGRWGGILAGLGFMLPGFLLMLLLSWLYLRVGFAHTGFHAALLGVQPAVIALIARACHRIGVHALVDAPLVAIGAIAVAADLWGVTFWLTLPAAGLAYVLQKSRRSTAAIILGIAFATAVFALKPVPPWRGFEGTATGSEVGTKASNSNAQATPSELFASGLRTGLLTFGGAYTAIPFLEHDAVEKGGWMSQKEFLDGVAMSGILPAPLIIFSTFVGFYAGGVWGAIAITLGIFLPAFSFSLLFHRHVENILHLAWLRHFLEGVTAAVVGIIVATTLRLAAATLHGVQTIGFFVVALSVLYLWKSKAAVPVVVIAAGIAGWLIARS